MKEQRPLASPIRFGVYEVDLVSEELRKNGLKIKLSSQPFQILALLLERPGQVVTREELQKKLWPDGTFVDFDHSLNTAINKIREALGDSAENPRFVETLARRGYRFIAPVESTGSPQRDPQPRQTTEQGGGTTTVGDFHQRKRWRPWTVLLTMAVLAIVAVLIYPRLKLPPPAAQRALTRLTFDAGLQFGATWSPDGRFIAYSSDRGGKFDIWVQPVSGGDAVQVTKGPGHNWQPDWSPDGKQIAFRSEHGDGGLYVVPALGGPERRIASFGYSPRWASDCFQILFETRSADIANQLYVVRLDGSPPREVFAAFLRQHEFFVRSAVWHPDGRRISVWVEDPAPGPGVWTIPVEGGDPVKLEFTPKVVEQVQQVTLGGTEGYDYTFDWAPSGRAMFFEFTLGGAKNLWKIDIEPETLRGTMLERLTTGPGPDTELALAPDGRRLAFTARSQHIGVWLFPFDAVGGRVTGKGEPVTSPGMEAWRQKLSPDGKKLGFNVARAGKWELWEKSLADGREGPVLADEYFRNFPQWSPDGTHLAYARLDPRLNQNRDRIQAFVWSAESHNEAPLTTATSKFLGIGGWSPDGSSLLVSKIGETDRTYGIWMVPLDGAPDAEKKARKLVYDPAYHLFQGHFSPNGRWIVFEAFRSKPSGAESTLYVVPTSGGPWTRITDGKHWDDKPNWSPDGKTIYFVSGRPGFFNLWGIRFDPVRGHRVGEPFRVTRFESPGLMIPEPIQNVELSLTQDRLALTMAKTSGSIWILDSVDR
jgi:Tol biopolymer transport system component/DNA-binding winged helix-turn-helix (wHTH) protein